MHYSIEAKTRKYVKGYGFLSFKRNLSNKYRKQLLDTAKKARLDALKTVTKKVAYKVAEAPRVFIGSKVTNKIVKPKAVPNETFKNVEEIIIRPEKKRKISE